MSQVFIVSPGTLCLIDCQAFIADIQHVDGLIKFGLYGLGLSAILIGGSIAVFGSYPVFSAFNEALSLVHDGGQISDVSGRDTDSELRFYSVMFVFYGAVLVQSARDLERYAGRIPILIGVFMLGGVARLIGYLTIGPPHALFQILMVIELTLPVILYACWFMRAKRRA